MRKLTYLTVGMILGSIVSGLGVVFAEGGNAEVVKGIQISFDHRLIHPEQGQPVIRYNGMYYASIQFIAEHLGAKVEPEEAMKMIRIIKKPVHPSCLPYYQRVLLPDGTLIPYGGKAVFYHGIKYHLHTGIYNHTGVLKQEKVHTKYGPGTLMLMEQTPPAVSQEKWVRTFYDLVVVRSLIDPYSLQPRNIQFTLEAEVTGNATFIKRDIIEVAKYWEISPQTAPVVEPAVFTDRFMIAKIPKQILPF